MEQYMPQINFNMNDDLDKEFREMVVKRKGFKKGVLMEALEEAVELWIKENEKKNE